MPEARRGRDPGTAALLGGLCVLPFLAANTIVANKIEPLFSFIRPGPHTSAFEYALLVVVLGLIAVGAFVAARPLVDRNAALGLRIYILNGTVGALMLMLFVALSVALGSEIYRCDVLGIPNCD